MDETSKDAAARTRRWMWWMTGILLCSPVLAVGFWFLAVSKAQDDYDAAVSRLYERRAAERTPERVVLSIAERTQLEAAKDEFLRRLSVALQRTDAPGDQRALLAHLRVLAEGAQWSLATGKFKAAQWEELAQPLDPLLSDAFVRRPQAFFEVRGYSGREAVSRLALRTLLQREQLRGTFAPERVTRDAPAIRIVELVRAVDTLAQLTEARTMVLNSFERAVAEAKNPLTAEQVAEFWQVVARLAEEEPASHASWLKRWEDEIFAANEFWRRDRRTSGIIAKMPRDPSSQTWRGRIQMPWTVANHARALDGIAQLLGEIEAGRAPSGPTLAKLARELDVTDPRRPGYNAARSLRSGLSQVYAGAQLRARALGWGAALNAAAGRDLAVEQAPEILRRDPCSGLPFQVRRDGKEIVVRGFGFDGDDDGGAPMKFLAPLPGGPGVRTKPLRVGWDLLDGDVEARVKIPE